MKLHQCLLLLALTPALASALPVAGEAAFAPLPIPALPLLATVAVGTEVSTLDGAAAPQQLATARGRNDATPSAALGAVVTGNSATNVSTGANIISNGSFANMSGLPVVIQNSGANVLIQNATVIHLQLR